jgi:hypothetical protein
VGAGPVDDLGRPDNRLAWKNVDLGDHETYAVEF